MSARNNVVHVRLTGDDLKFVDWLAHREHLTKSELIRWLIHTYRIAIEGDVVFDQSANGMRVTVTRVKRE